MIQLLKNVFGKSPKTDYKLLLENGAQIIDVRTPGEYQGGHIQGSLNIPLQNLQSNMSKIKKDKPVITCCASGMRSGSAKTLLQSHGYTQVFNAGSWYNLKKYEK